jgi:hypothetical protein
VGDGAGFSAVSAHIGGLDPVVYHFRVVATNSLGTVTSGDQTFSFYPESCPNATVRQQTGAAGLPDCRAYELVSPGIVGSGGVFVGGVNSPRASNPSRFSFTGGLGTIPGPWNPPNSIDGDLYVATRTGNGWSTSYVGLSGDQAYHPTGAPGGAYMTD